jgi:hypothetical protein
LSYHFSSKNSTKKYFKIHHFLRVLFFICFLRVVEELVVEGKVVDNAMEVIESFVVDSAGFEEWVT